jgi:hypothetical protein
MFALRCVGNTDGGSAMGERRTEHLSVLMTDQLRAALKHAAERRFTTPSEYVRPSVIEITKERHDG